MACGGAATLPCEISDAQRIRTIHATAARSGADTNPWWLCS